MGLAHVSHREGPFVKIKSPENQAFTEFKYLKKTNYSIAVTMKILE